MKKYLVAMMICAVFLVACTNAPIVEKDTYCNANGVNMSLSEARAIASESVCTEQSSLEDTSLCNNETGTWWIGLTLKKQGCSPACVITIANKSAEINWRCTGLIEPTQ